MTLVIISAVAVGLAAGLTIIPQSYLPSLDGISSWALTALVFLVGIGIGRSRDVIPTLKSVGLRLLALPFGVAVGSLLGSFVAGKVFNMDTGAALAVGAGFGWYSLSAVLLSQLHSPALGALAFISNVMRELIAVLLMPILAKHLHPLAAIAPGGATTMDTTLPIISQCTDSKTTLMAFANGVVLSSMVPVIVPLLLKL